MAPDSPRLPVPLQLAPRDVLASLAQAFPKAELRDLARFAIACGGDLSRAQQRFKPRTGISPHAPAGWLGSLQVALCPSALMVVILTAMLQTIATQTEPVTTIEVVTVENFARPSSLS